MMKKIKGKFLITSIVVFAVFTAVFAQNLQNVFAQSARQTEYSNPTSSKFRLIICDGPEQINHIDPKTGAYNKNYTNDPNFIACDFNGLMKQVNHFITIMIIVGTLAAVVMFTYAGWLYMTGDPGKKKHAHSIFRNVAIGFVFMLTAWFIVYELLNWLGPSSGAVKALLGNP